jgi:HD-like signal output (HDOD) protein
VWRAIDRGVRRGEETYEAAEARVFGRSHMEIGTYLCERWQFSEKIVDAISRIEARDDQSDNQLASVLKTAHDIANKTGFGFPACEDDGPQILEESEELAKIAEDLQTDVEYQLRILDS